MPAYNASDTVARAVTCALSQTVADLEVLVVDDGSTDPVADALTELRSDQRLRVIRRAKNGGVSAARNTALVAASAPLVAQLDTDDFWQSDHLEHLLPKFSDPQIGLVYANAAIDGYAAAERWIAPRTPADGLPDWISDRALQPVNDLRTLYRANPIPAPAVVMRTTAVRAVGGYPEWLSVGEEYLVYIRLARAGWRFAYVDRPSATYRWPEPGRGATFNERRNSREEAKLFAVLALTSRPNAAIWRRLGEEVLGLAETHLPRLAGVGRAARDLMRPRGPGSPPTRRLR
jgi:glycosyltransferase involved in cell wall biosynthesis